MNTPLLALPLSASIADEVKKKRVLLVDTSHAKRDLRAEVLRKLGMYVDSAADIAEARSWSRRKAMRALPPAPPDSEGGRSKPAARSLDDLLREELR